MINTLNRQPDPLLSEYLAISLHHKKRKIAGLIEYSNWRMAILFSEWQRSRMVIFMSKVVYVAVTSFSLLKLYSTFTFSARKYNNLETFCGSCHSSCGLQSYPQLSRKGTCEKLHVRGHIK